MKRVMESDAAMSEDVVAYNIIPLDAPSVTNVIVSFPEVKNSLWQEHFLSRAFSPKVLFDGVSFIR